MIEQKKVIKLVSGTHGLRSELSRRDNGSNLCMCCDMDRKESVEHLLLECPLYKDVRDEVLLRIINLSEGFRKEWFDGDETHRCVMLLRDYGAFVTKPFMSIEMA
eukprot:Awhi_evm1s9657